MSNGSKKAPFNWKSQHKIMEILKKTAKKFCRANIFFLMYMATNISKSKVNIISRFSWKFIIYKVI